MTGLTRIIIIAMLTASSRGQLHDVNGERGMCWLRQTDKTNKKKSYFCLSVPDKL